VNVLYLTNNADRASTTVATSGWITNLGPLGLKPVVASPKVGEFSSWLGSRGLPCYQQAFPVPSKRKPWEALEALWRLWRIVRRHSIQLVHCNEQDIYPIGCYLAKLCRLPLLVSVHCRMNRGFGEWAFGGRRRPDRIFFLTKGSQEVCRPAVEGVIPESSWRLLYNGLDLTDVRPDAELGRRFRQEHGLGDGPLIGAASWLRPGKQVEQMFEVAARLKSSDYTLVLAGGVAPGEEVYAEEVLKQGQRMLGDRLRYLGCLTELKGFYNALDLYVNTSKEETCSISVIESLACGCPVVGYPSVSVDEQVLPSGGEIVPQDDREALAAVVDQWLSAPGRLAAARAGARSRAEEAFDIRKLSKQLWEEYQAVLGGVAA
jgi:glycosyltransferase involved in cell wall biosynthesis